MHQWGDKDVDWEGIDRSAEYIGKNLRRWGRVSVIQYKEKFGTVRVYCALGWRSLFCITHPGWVSYKVAGYPKWLMTLDIYVLSRIIPCLNKIIVPYHKWLYQKLYEDMVKKYPHLIEEILCGADFRDLLMDIWRKYTMYLHCDDKIAKDFEVLDLDSGEFIKNCIWVNQTTGQYEIHPNLDELNYTQVLHGNIVLVYKGE